MRTYTSTDHITSVDDVKLFFESQALSKRPRGERFHHLTDERNLNFHPDDDFRDYIQLETHAPSFTDEECDTYNRMMDESLAVCETANADIYEIGLENVMKKFEM